MAVRLAVLLGVACWLGGGGDAVAAGTFVVDGADPTKCSDTAPGAGTEGNPPYCTISAAADARGGPGTTILVKPAIYREWVTVRASGAEGSPFVIQALGPGVVLEGAEDFSDPALWTPATGTVWHAVGVNWNQARVFVDGAPLILVVDPATAGGRVDPGTVRPGTFGYASGGGLYVNLGGDNPGTHQTLVSGRRTSGFGLGARSWVTIDGFTVTRGGMGVMGAIHLDGHYSLPSNNITITHNTVTFASYYGIFVSEFTNVLIGSNVVADSGAGGISLNRSQNSAIQDNEVFRTGRSGLGIILSDSGGSLIQRNAVHDNGGTGIQIRGTGNLSLQNRSWRNGGHGFQLSSQSVGNRHVGDVAWGNADRGFSVGWEATGTQIFNSIGVNNGLTTGEFDLAVDSTATPGFASNANLFWNRSSQPPIKYAGTKYATLAAFTAATGQDAQSLQADPRFLHPEAGDFRLLPGSPVIDAADSSVANWPATDAAGQARVDDPATADTGAGPIPYADRGALEFLPFGPPLAALTVTPASGTVPLTVTADASGSADPDGAIVAYLFDFGDGTVVGPQAEATASHTYPQAGTFTVTVTVTDNEGGTDAASTMVAVTQPPVAALTVTPASGMAPLTVTADASASRDPDGTIVSYRFDFGHGDGTVWAPQVGPTASPTFFGGGIFAVTVTVTDNLGATGTASATVTVVGPIRNWVSNGSFEFDTSGWTAYGGATLQRIPGGVEGAFALEVRGPVTTTEFGINDSPNWVAKTPAADTRYRFMAWARSPGSTGQGRLKVREYLNGVQVGGATASAALPLTPAWQLLLVDHVTQAAGSTLDFQVAGVPFAPGAVFEVDHIAIRIVPTTSNQPPNGGIDSPAGDLTIGPGDRVSFTSTGSDPDNHLPLTYLWDFAGGEPQQGRGEDPGPVEFNTPGTYTVTLTVIDSLGLADPTPASRVITVTGPNQAPNGVIDTPAANMTITAGQSVTFAGTGSDPEGHLPLSFLWTFGGGAPNSTVEDPGAVTFSTRGTYTVTFTVTNSLGLADPTPASRVITVTGYSQAPNGVIDSPAANMTITAGQSVTFAGTATDPDGILPLRFLWTFGGAAPNSTLEDPGPVVFSTPGRYTVTFTVTDRVGEADPTPDSRVITVVCSPNLVCNSSFEGSTTGWGPYGGATLQRVPGGQEGAFALEVRGPATTAAFGINDSPNWVARTGAAGTRHRFSAWVRAETSTGRARLRVREYLNGVQVGVTTYSPFLPLTPDWQLLTIDHIAQAAESTLDFQVLDYPVTPGEVFQTDNIVIRVVP